MLLLKSDLTGWDTFDDIGQCIPSVLMQHHPSNLGHSFHRYLDIVRLLYLYLHHNLLNMCLYL